MPVMMTMSGTRSASSADVISERSGIRNPFGRNVVFQYTRMRPAMADPREGDTTDVPRPRARPELPHFLDKEIKPGR